MFETFLMNFYEKALFVKTDVAAALVVNATALCPSRYASIRTFGEPTLWWLGALMRSVFSGQRRCNLPIGLPGGWTKFVWRSRLMRSEALSGKNSRGHPPL